MAKINKFWYICCNSKLSMCCIIISVWGMLQLTVMAIGFLVKSVLLVEDIPINPDGEIENLNKFYESVDEKYIRNTLTCFTATILYFITFLVALHQYFANLMYNKWEQKMKEELEEEMYLD